MPPVMNYASAVALDDTRVLMVGGFCLQKRQFKVCEILNIKCDTRSSAASLPEPLIQPLVSLAAGQVFIVPKKSNLPYIFPTWMLVFDPRENTHSYISRLPRSVRTTEGACLTSTEDKLYLLGGEQSLAQQYDIVSKEWMQLQPPISRYSLRYGCCAVVRGDSILLCGGSTEEDNERNRVEEYNTRTKKWEMLDSYLPFQFDQRHSLVAHYSV